MKIYRGRLYLGDQLITESWFYEGDEESMDWLEYFKSDTKNSSHPLVRYEVESFVRNAKDKEVIVPENPSTLAELGIEREVHASEYWQDEH